MTMPFILGLHASLAEEFAMTWPFNGDNVFFFVVYVSTAPVIFESK